MTIKTPKPLSRRDLLHGLGYLSLGLVLLVATALGLVHGDLSSRLKEIHWENSPVLFSLNALALSACTIWFIRRGLQILANKSEA